MKIFPLKYRPVITSLFLFSSMFIFANNVGAQGQDDGICKSISGIASAAMRARQANAPIADVIEKLAKTSKDQKIESLITGIIKNAYSTPRFSTEESIKNAVQDFENAYYLQCLRELEGNNK